jgi:hypothetical protein
LTSESCAGGDAPEASGNDSAGAGSQGEAALPPGDGHPTPDGWGDAADDQLDVSDFSPEELQRLRMLRLLGTATAADIVAMIRAERTTSEAKPKKKRLGLF